MDELECPFDSYGNLIYNRSMFINWDIEWLNLREDFAYMLEELGF